MLEQIKNREYIKVKLLQTQQMLEILDKEGYSIMVSSLKQKEESLNDQLRLIDQLEEISVKKDLQVIKIEKTANFINEKINNKIDVGIILGSGLGGLVNEIDIEVTIPYTEIPDFPVSTVDGHSGKFIFGKLGGKNVLAMQGRFHYYEGYSMKEVTFPVRVMKMLGINDLIVSNASGGLNPDYNVGDIVIISDHINMFPEHPLRGKNIDELGPRFPDMSKTYDEKMRNKAKEIAIKNNLTVKEGIYVGLSGPTFETPAEYLMFRNLGADLVGMSTVPEVIVARHMNMNVFGISIVTDSGVPGQIMEVSHEEVQEVASKAEPKMTIILKELISEL